MCCGTQSTWYDSQPIEIEIKSFECFSKILPVFYGKPFLAIYIYTASCELRCFIKLADFDCCEFVC